MCIDIFNTINISSFGVYWFTRSVSLRWISFLWIMFRLKIPKARLNQFINGDRLTQTYFQLIFKDALCVFGFWFLYFDRFKHFYILKIISTFLYFFYSSRTAVAPLERLKILLQVQNRHNVKYNGTVQGLKYIWKTEGFRGMFKGNGTNCARIIPNSAVKFFSYEQASKYALHNICFFFFPLIFGKFFISMSFWSTVLY